MSLQSIYNFIHNFLDLKASLASLEACNFIMSSDGIHDSFVTALAYTHPEGTPDLKKCEGLAIEIVHHSFCARVS